MADHRGRYPCPCCLWPGNAGPRLYLWLFGIPIGWILKWSKRARPSNLALDFFPDVARPRTRGAVHP